MAIALKAFRAVSNDALKAETLPTRIKILDWGESKTNSGETVLLDDETLKVFEANQKKIGREVVPLDFNHNTVPGTKAYESDKEPRAIAAYGVPEVVKGEGLFLSGMKWTPSGNKSAKDYIDLSPAPVIENGRVIGLHSCALTPAGAIADLCFYSAFDDMEAMLKALSADQNKKENDMDLAHFRKTLGLPDTATAEQVTAAFDAKIKTPPVPAEAKAFSADDLAKSVAEAIKPLSAKIETFEKSVKDAQAASEKVERDALIAEASKDAKVIPFSAETLATMPLAAIKEMISKLPKTVPMSVRAIVPLSAEEKKTLEGSFGRAADKLTNLFNSVRN